MVASDGILRSALSNRHVELTLMPTEACNFRCTYCYEDFALGRMAPEVVRGVKAFLTARAPEAESISLAWFGGEPLLALDVIRDVQGHARELARSHAGLAVHANMTTNGWRLDRATFDEVVELGIRQFQISFDGPAEVHDRKRRRLDGKGTFARIWRNVLAMRDAPHDFHVILRVHADAENLESLFGFVDELKQQFGHDRRFEVFLKRLSRYGGPNDAHLHLLETAEHARRFDALQRHLDGDAKPVHVRGAGGTSSPDLCYAAKGNSHVVRADGRLCKCTVALDHPANTVGRLNEDGTVEIDGSRVRPWMRGVWSGVAAELLCPLVGIDAAVAAARASEPVQS